jgi:beta-lactamase regulating signal transducer with metallopeptidase domain
MMPYDIFKTVLNMSLTASFVIAAILLARLLLRRAPKWIGCALWAVVLFNLVCPFKLESAFSLIPSGIPRATISQPTHSVQFPDDMTVETIDSHKEQYAQNPGAFPLKRNITPENLVVYAWYAGMFAMLLYAVIAYVRLKRRVALAVRVADNVFESDGIDSPFVLGLIRPRIYISAGMAPNGCIIEHERAHIRRRDHLVAVLAFGALALHWFNPLVWTAYFLMLRDMESACDEAVLRRSDADIRREYSTALLKLSRERMRMPVPLAFGEQGVKERVKNVLNFRKPSRITVAAAVALLVVLSVGFAVTGTNGERSEPLSAPDDAPEAVIDLVKTFGSQFQKVQLVAPAPTPARGILENYSDFVTPELLKKWTDNPETAPGRVGSSPWPDRIDVTGAEKLSETEYAVSGTIILISSAELKDGGAAFVQPIKLHVTKNGAEWKISDVNLGKWEKGEIWTGFHTSRPVRNISLANGLSPSSSELGNT